MRRGAEKGTAASLIATIAGLIVLYILFLPPAERASLLDEQSPSIVTTGSRPAATSSPALTRNQSVFKTSPGRISYQNLDEYEYNLAAFTLFKTTDAKVIDSVNNFRIRNGWFDKVPKNVTFTIPDLDNTENVMMSWNAPRHQGTLTVLLNGAEIYSFDVESSSPTPIALKKQYLKKGENILTFKVSPVGMRFWSTNEYSFSDVKIVGDITDTARQESKNSFYISPEEGESLEKATLRFNPDCNVREAGVLEVTLNGRSVFTGVPDCGILNTYDLSPSLLNTGKNTVSFRTRSLSSPPSILSSRTTSSRRNRQQSAVETSMGSVRTAVRKISTVTAALLSIRRASGVMSQQRMSETAASALSMQKSARDAPLATRTRTTTSQRAARTPAVTTRTMSARADARRSMTRTAARRSATPSTGAKTSP
jgi:hypothetical protein